MKKLTKFVGLSVMLLLMVCCAVKQNANRTVRFERRGGGNIEFEACLNATADTLFVTVDGVQFRDTLISKEIIKTDENSTVFDAIKSIKVSEIDKNCETTPKTDEQGHALCTGTWTYFYIKTETGFAEVRNVYLKRQLAPLESLVRKEICGE